MPSPETASKADTTPTNRNYADHVPEDVLKRVNEAPGNITQLRCLIDNIECRHVVDYAHVLARADGKKNELMSSLERSWGVERGTVNSNTHRNIFRLSAKFHRLFDEGKWLLLPEMKILDEYQQHFRSGGLPIDFPAVTHDSYKYTLIPHPDMRQVAIHRRAQSIEISSASAFKTYVYPYEDFPTIVPMFILVSSFAIVDRNSRVTTRSWPLQRGTLNWVKDLRQSLDSTIIGQKLTGAMLSLRRPLTQADFNLVEGRDPSSRTFNRQSSV